MSLYDAPNQQVVRADGSGPGIDYAADEDEVEPVDEPGDDLEAMTKDELLAMAQELGVSPANASMNKAELIAGIRAAEE